jgi:Zn-dependent metalloprotease
MTGDPDNMSDYWNTDDDSGGVHTNSNIHNKAAYNILITVDANSQLIFPPREVAILYYLCLTRLNNLATFSKALTTLVDVATTYYPDPLERQRKLEAIRAAYKSVGIT